MSAVRAAAPPICMQMRARPLGQGQRENNVRCARELRLDEGRAAKLDADFRYLSLPLFERECTLI